MLRSALLAAGIISAYIAATFETRAVNPPCLYVPQSDSACVASGIAAYGSHYTDSDRRELRKLIKRRTRQ